MRSENEFSEGSHETTGGKVEMYESLNVES